MKASTLPAAWGWVPVLLFALLLPTQQALAAGNCSDTDTACIRAALTMHTVRALTSWKGDFAKPLAERMGAASADLIDYVTLDNLVNGYAERPRAAAVDPALLRDAQAAFAEIPSAIRNLFVKRLAGIFFLENLGSTGYTEYVDNPAGDPVAAFILLDAGVLKKFTANAWASWKENTPFKSGSEFALQARIEDPANDDRKNAIQYILLHELEHVLSVGRNIHPPWDRPPKPESKGRYPYLDLSWTVARGTASVISRYDGAFPQRRDVVYYADAKLDGAQMMATYANLEATNFPTIYTATRPGDDFAEAFASYVHVVRLGRPWNVTIEHNGQIATVINSC